MFNFEQYFCSSQYSNKIQLMRNIILFGLILLLNNLFAQQNDSVTESQVDVVSVDVEPLENSLLWKIEGKGLKKISYLFGTIHMIPAKSFFLPPNTKESIDACERMTFEINMNDMDAMGMDMSFMMNLFMKDGTTLPSLISKEDYQMVIDHFSKKDFPLPNMMIDKIKPMFLSVLASTDMDMFGIGGNDEKKKEDPMGGIKSYEMEFMEFAKENEMEMGGLETVAYQMSMFDSIPYKDQAMMLVESIKMESDSLSSGNEMDKLIELYVGQNLTALQQAINAESAGIGKFEDLLLNQRNKNWIPIMIEQMNDKSTFFAVGAGHLAGKYGVINLLKQEGYTLTPISKQTEEK